VTVKPIKPCELIRSTILSFCFGLILFVACNFKSAHTQTDRIFFDPVRIAISRDTTLPKPIGWTSDYAKLFSAREVASLDSLLSAYEWQTSVEIAVVTIDSVMLAGNDLDDLTLRLLNSWGVGKRDKNNGILIGIAPTLRRLRIQNGFGIEPFLSDEETKAIIDSVIIPKFKEQGFYEGIRNGILAIQAKLKENGL
jgi:uncharacterized protein